jgi:hypothetical protein
MSKLFKIKVYCKGIVTVHVFLTHIQSLNFTKDMCNFDPDCLMLWTPDEGK